MRGCSSRGHLSEVMRNVMEKFFLYSQLNRQRDGVSLLKKVIITLITLTRMEEGEDDTISLDDRDACNGGVVSNPNK